MKDKKDQALFYFNNGFNCAQSILSTYSSLFGMDTETAKKIACGFGAGMARMQETCGAVSGSFMLLGLKHGNVIKEDEESKERTYQLVREFSDRFKEKHGSIKCKDIIDCDINTSAGRELYDERNISEKCEELIRDAASFVEDLLIL